MILGLCSQRVIVLLAVLAVTMNIARGQSGQSAFNTAFASDNANVNQANLETQIGGNNNAPIKAIDNSGQQGVAGPSASAGGQGGQNGK
uniref:Uncharacterized protein n=1 Tax=Rhodnius prolixus TaxID=13249 RepID=T1IGE2_RHOPR